MNLGPNHGQVLLGSGSNHGSELNVTIPTSGQSMISNPWSQQRIISTLRVRVALPYLGCLHNWDAKPTHPIAYFDKDTVAPHKAAVYGLVISQHIFPVEIDPPWKLYIQNTPSSLNRYDVSITCIKIYDFELSFRFRNVIGSRCGGSDIFNSGPSLVRQIYNLT